MYSARIIVCLSLVFSFSMGCATLRGYPTVSSDPDAELQALAAYFQPSLVQQCLAKTSPIERRSCRDEILNGRIRAMDIHFSVFREGLFEEGVTNNIAVDWAVLALNATGAVAGTATVKAALSAASGGLVGAKGAFDKNVYFEKTMPVILSRMLAERKKVLATLREGMAKENIEEYPLHRALIDIEDYYTAGTMPGALMAVAEDAGKTAQRADARMEVVFKRTSNFLSPERRTRIGQLLDSLDALDDAAVLSLNKMPPVTDPEIEKTVNIRDFHNARFTDPKTARAILRMRIVMSDRNDKALDAWEAALRTVQ